jgi:hypothetical protein
MVEEKEKWIHKAHCSVNGHHGIGRTIRALKEIDLARDEEICRIHPCLLCLSEVSGYGALRLIAM